MNQTKEMNIDNENYKKYFMLLDLLRESGKMNMFGVPSWLVDTFDVTKKEANAIFEAWTKQFQTNPPRG